MPNALQYRIARPLDGGRFSQPPSHHSFRPQTPAPPRPAPLATREIKAGPKRTSTKSQRNVQRAHFEMSNRNVLKRSGTPVSVHIKDYLKDTTRIRLPGKSASPETVMQTGLKRQPRTLARERANPRKSREAQGGASPRLASPRASSSASCTAVIYRPLFRTPKIESIVK